MISDYLEVRMVPKTFADRKNGWQVATQKIIEVAVEPVIGADEDAPFVA